ncbi:chromatin associated protein KTI12 [Parachaetomium inaequale]|uniref:Chromatin associated protein KTI12 n=1 Tax=Parachaetomium inaequale TaxID=2588326 RepID=A0AAN6PAP8_9PEZI|nr:chromatin associated protein KTI12 [Parachaetomium inaequale]
MPLIIITGLPTSGKTTRARQLHAYLSSRIASSSSSTSQSSQPNNTQPSYRLHLISDTTLSIPRTVYDLSPSQLPAHVRSANASEKDARAAAYAAVKRVLSPRDIVILDGLNYIKGWRYQLFCEAKNVRTGSCVLQIGARGERARGVNEARLERRRRRLEGDGGADGDGDMRGRGGVADGGNDEQEGGNNGHQGKVSQEGATQEQTDDDDDEPYEPANWDNLVFRYEEPNPMTRWDSPLFTLIWDDDETQTRAVFDQIWDAIAGEGRKAVKPNQSTVQRDKDPGGDYLYVLERETQDIVKKILERQSDEGGGEVSLPRVNNSPGEGRAGGDLVVELPGKKVGLPQLQRYRRAFVALNRGGIGLEAVGKLAAERLRESFVGYLNDAFEKDG